MTIHWLYQGGGRTENPNSRVWPAPAPTPTQVATVAGHRNPVSFALEARLNFGALDGPLLQYVTEDASGELLETEGELDQDCFLLLIPVNHLLQYVYVRVVTAAPAGLTMDIQRVTVATPPTEPTVSATLAAGVSASALASFLYTPAAFVTTNNQGVQVRFNEIPAGGMGNLDLIVTAVVARFETGY